ncbi:MAG: hypothetical protein ACHQHN_16145 [Sphingobacteriales bacterium]
MKQNFVLIFSLMMLFSCDHIEKKKVQNSALIGSWTLSSVAEFNDKGKGNITTFNVCPIIVFNIDGIGQTPGDFFQWYSDNRKVTINYVENRNKKDFVIDGGTYEIKYTDRKTYLEAVLTNSNKKISYFLGKNK